MKTDYLSVIRHTLSTFGGIFIAFGIVGTNEVEAIVGGISSLYAAYLGIRNARKQKKQEKVEETE